MSSSDGKKKVEKIDTKKIKQQRNINFLACTKFNSKQNNSRSPRPIKNIAFCSFIQEASSSSEEEELPSITKEVQQVQKAKCEKPNDVAKHEPANTAELEDNKDATRNTSE
ncbi:hypothetical protein ABFS83_02G065700 [Erythranthe nasuta]